MLQNFDHIPLTVLVPGGLKDDTPFIARLRQL